MRTFRLFTILLLASVLSGPALRAQSAADFKALEQQIQALQAKVDKLQREQADSTVAYSGSAAASKDVIQEDLSKIKLSSGVTELKLFGDIRFRYQYDQLHPKVDVPALVTDDRNRFRFRLRIGADVQLGDQFFAGIVLATGEPADSNNQTYTEGYDNYSIYVDKAFAGWTPTDWFQIVLGKQSNPFYTTDLVWDPDITPAGAVETIDISKALFPDSRFSLQLISLQGVFENGASFNTGADTSWQFDEQLKGTYSFNKDTSVTFAPGFMTYTDASLTGLMNSQPFSKTTDEIAASGTIPAETPQEETKDLAIITAPGDISFKIGGLPTKIYWDFAYNADGSTRATDEYFLDTHTSKDDFAWLAGFQIGSNVHAGDLSFYANYRQVGIDSIDPNLNDSDFALSYLNVQGIKAGVAYNFTDSFVGAVTYYKAWTLRQGVTGGEATGGAQLANARAVDVLQVDMGLKF